METKNKFYIYKSSDYSEILAGYSYNVYGQLVEMQGRSSILKHSIDNSDSIIIDIPITIYASILVHEWNNNGDYNFYAINNITDSSNENYILKNSRLTCFTNNRNVKEMAFTFISTTLVNWITCDEYFGHRINPHYKKLEKKYSKENSQMFFRESLEGKITLWGTDYLFVKNANLEDTLLFRIFKNNSIYAASTFNKSDCKFDHSKKSIELNLKYDDKYSKILDAYENTYDLIKLAPAITPLTVTKRSVVQIYIQGEGVMSSFSGGTYWETDVDEAINDEDALTRKYHFAKGPKFIEVNLTGFNYDINAAYKGLWDSDVWNAVSIREVYGRKYKMDCCIKFTKIYNANTQVYGSDINNILVFSNGTSSGVRVEQHPTLGTRYFCNFDTYKIEIYTGRDGAGTKIYQSDKLYGKDGNFTLAAGDSLYPMSRLQQPIPQMDPTPNTFNLGAFVIEYQMWGRLLCDTDVATDGTVMYDLPNDDFATARRNYRKCIGLNFGSDASVIKVLQNQNTSEEPTSYGINDFGEYFIQPYSLDRIYSYPLARSTWANTSLWVRLTEGPRGFENWNAKHYKEYTLKNSYHIADVIKALLAKIDPTIKHDKTSDYSQFLYNHSGVSADALGGCDIYITQKTNILKGEYDQAAQKAEIKFKQIMEMLRDCFRCYWFIDSENRLRIEHISYFMNGMSYDSPEIQFDLTKKYDKFNKVNSLYNQQEVEFDKTDLVSRYEFAWMDDVTDSMGNLQVDVLNKYIQKDKTEEINIDGFTSDIDYMLFMPDNFSNDGFALLMANSNKKVPIVQERLRSEKQNNYNYEIYSQNWYASFNQLIRHYMYDMPGNIISYNNINDYYLHVVEVKKCMKHEIQFPSSQLSIDINKLIATEIGNGHIEEMSTNIDTDMTKIELRYGPH